MSAKKMNEISKFKEQFWELSGKLPSVKEYDAFFDRKLRAFGKAVFWASRSELMVPDTNKEIWAKGFEQQFGFNP